MPRPQRASLINLSLVVQNQEYSRDFPRGTKHIKLQARQAVDFRLAIAPGGTLPNGPYFTVKSGTFHETPFQLPKHKAFTLYFRDPSNADTVVEMVVATEE